MDITLYALGFAVCLIACFASLLSSGGGWVKENHWLVYGIGSLLIGIAAIHKLESGTSAQISLWDIIPGVTVSITMDPLSAFFILVVCAIAVPVCIYARAYYQEKGSRIHGALFGLFLLSLVLVLSADNGWLFLIVWEVMSLLSFGLVMYSHEQPRVRRAGFIYLVMTHAGTLFLMIAFLLLNAWSGSFRFSDWAVAGMNLADGQRNLVFGLALAGFGTKAGMVPFHVWLPRAHPAAPAPVSALMSAVMVKVGLYGLLRVIWDWFDGGTLWWGAILLACGLATSIIGALYLAVKDDLKQLLAFSTVENMGILLMALGVAGISYAAGSHSLAVLAFAALLLHLINHAVFKALLFLVSGSVQHGAGTVRLNQLGSLIKSMPYTASFFFIGAAALAAVPLFNGFVGEWLLFQSFVGGALSWPVQWKGAAAVSIAGLGMVGVLAAAGMVKAFGTAFLGKPRSKEAEHAHESPRAMLAGMLLLTAGVVLGGILPAQAWAAVNSAIGRWFPGALPEELPALPSWAPSYHANGEIPGPSMSPSLSIPYLAAIMAVIFILILAAVRMMYGRTRYTRNEVWGCGHSLTERMQYTATSLTHPTLMFFHLFFRPKITKEAFGAKPFRLIKIQLQIKHVAEVYVYFPIVKSVMFLSHKILEIQNGRIQAYLAYILLTLLALLFVYIL